MAARLRKIGIAILLALASVGPAVMVTYAASGLAAGCSGPNQRAKQVAATIIAVNIARDEFSMWDQQHQLAIVEAASTREEGEAKIAAYRAKRDLVLTSFELVYRALAIAATQTDNPSLRGAMEAAETLLKAIRGLKGDP